MPQFVLYRKNHPLWPGGNAYEYECDVDLAKQSAFSNFVKGCKVKEKYEKELNAARELQLFPGDAIFVREQGTIVKKILMMFRLKCLQGARCLSKI